MSETKHKYRVVVENGEAEVVGDAITLVHAYKIAREAMILAFPPYEAKPKKSRRPVVTIWSKVAEWSPRRTQQSSVPSHLIERRK